MTFTGETFCHPAGAFEARQETPLAAGEEGRLCVAALHEGMVQLGGAGRYLPAGSLLALAGPLQLTPTGGPFGCSGVWLGGMAATAFAKELEAPLLLAPGACPEGVELLFRLQQGGGAAKQNAAAFALLCLLAAAPKGGQAQPPLVAAALGKMHGHYGEVYGVEELAAELGVSKAHLIRSFKAALGLAPGRYLALVRIEAAKRLLLEGLALETVAGLCGFSGANYLCRVFKKEVGQSPAAWQHQNAMVPRQPQAQAAKWEESLYL